SFTYELRALAFVVTPKGDVTCVPLGKLAPVEEAILAWRHAVTSGQDPQTAGKKLRRLVWLPLEKYLGQAKTVLISPDGFLSALPFAALPGSKDKSYLLEEVTIGYVTSGRQLLELAAEQSRPEGKGLLALGGLDYGERRKDLKTEKVADSRGVELDPK